MRLRDLVEWVELRGRIWAFRIVILGVLVWVTLSGIGIVGSGKSQQLTVIVAIPLILYLMMEVFLTSMTNLEEGMSLGEGLFPWSDLTPTLKERARKTSKIDMIASSSESFYVMLKDEFATYKDKQLRILVREWDGQSVARYFKLSNYENQWKSIANPDRNVQVEVRYCRNDTLRGIIFDRESAYLGFYTWQEPVFRAQNVPAIRCTKWTSLGRYLLDVYGNRFEHYWETGSQLPPPPLRTPPEEGLDSGG